MSDTSTQSDEFISVSLDKDNRETISGKSLMITAYGTIFVLIIFYLLSILFREKKVLDEANRLKKNIKEDK